MIKIIFKYFIYVFISLFITFDSSFNNNTLVNDYYFTLEIPKIYLSVKGFKYNDNNNDVDKGIFLAKDYSFNKSSGSLVIASHSGNSIISYFKHLDLLRINDDIIINTEKDIFYYKVIDIYKIKKNGKFKYINDNNLIYLITCDKNNNKKQIVIKGKMENQVKKSQFF
ncbi:MAG: sortase [Bacilli bacterium]|nr:sortase [Bacilli bacterium]